MLIYNHDKEFIGLDESILRMLGYGSLQELQHEATDFADLFVKKPGYIHNFQNFQWIDFVLHSESEHAKVIIEARGKRFEADLLIKPFYLTANPSEDAYQVNFEHIKPLGSVDGSAIPEPVAAETPAPPIPETQPAATPKQHFEPPKPPPAPEPSPVVEPPVTNERVTLDMPEMHETAPEEEQFPDFNKPLEIEEDLFIEEESAITPAPEPIAAPEPVAAPEAAPQPATALEEEESHLSSEEAEIIASLNTPSDYVYDPQIASDELGLPVDLIEEFIGDFISQAHEFHDELFTAAGTSDFETVQVLSHKLKGVAANLRIEDAFEVLANANTSKEQTHVEANLKQFYRIIAKLEGKELPTGAVPQPKAAPEAEPALFGNHEPVVGLKEADAPAAQTPSPAEEEDLYSFDLPLAEAPEEPAAATTADVEEDLYNFDLPTEEETPPAAKEQEEDLYSFDLPAQEEPTPTAEESDDDLYNFDAPPSAEEIASASDDTYEFDMPQASTEPEEPAEPVIEEAPAPVQTPAPEASFYDIEKAANELGLSPELVEELAKDFVTEANGMREGFDTAINSGDSNSWHGLAYQLKGLADNMRMHDVSNELEALIKTEDADAARQTLERLYSHLGTPNA